MPGEQTKTDKKVGLAATHRLFQMENRLARNTSQTGDALADEVFHPMGDGSLLEEGRSIALCGDQLVELLDLVTKLDGQRVRLKYTGISDSFHRMLLIGRTTSSCYYDSLNFLHTAPGIARKIGEDGA